MSVDLMQKLLAQEGDSCRLRELADDVLIGERTDEGLRLVLGQDFAPVHSYGPLAWDSGASGFALTEMRSF